LRIGHGAADTQQGARGWADLEALLRAFPSHGVTRSALARIAQHKQETEGDAAALAWLEQGKTRYANTALEELFWYRTARHKHAAGQREPAEREYLQLADKFPYPRGVHFDDALFYAAEVAVDLKRPREAITYLERLLRERESAHLMGSYERPRYVPSQRKIAIILEDELRDRAAARDAWHKLYASFTTSLERDDALFREAQLWKADGDLETACSRLRNLASTFPSSRYAPCAEDLCSAGTPRTPATTDDAKGEPNRKSCRDYVRRAWSDGTRLKDAAPSVGDADTTSAP
jgi:TolA-binding protein